MKWRYWIIISGLLALFSCREDEVTSSSSVRLEFSADTVFLDTIFTTIGSSTRRFKVFNRNADKVIISSVRLGRGTDSHFRLNVDGSPGKDIRNVEIEGEDSIFVFVDVSVDVMGTSELLYTDSIIFSTNGRDQHVQLVTLAKDAYFHHPTTTVGNLPISIVCDETWTDDKPHVIYGYLVVDEGCTLDIQEGAEIHFHKGAGLWVYDGGTLRVNGTPGNEVVFQGDRLEPFYEEAPGQWEQIWLSLGSIDNEINYALIKNGTIGIRIDSLSENANPILRLNNTIIRNCSAIGIFGNNADIEATNTVVSNCGQYNLVCNFGGSYDFKHCTFANYWGFSNRQTPAVLLNNWYEFDNTIFVNDLNRADFSNCIIYGDQDSEIIINENTDGNFNYSFHYCLLNIEPNPQDNSYDISDPIYFNNILLNQDPRFINEDINYELDTLSPAMDAGDPVIGVQVPFDLNNNTRDFNGIPDLGAYERYE